MTITLDRQVVSQHCDPCSLDFTVVRGSVYAGATPCGLYLLALHGHTSSGRLAHLAVAMLTRDPSDPKPVAIAIEVAESPSALQFSMVNWAGSPWEREAYLGRMLDRDEALASPLKDLALHVSEHIVRDLPEARVYFS